VDLLTKAAITGPIHFSLLTPRMKSMLENIKSLMIMTPTAPVVVVVVDLTDLPTPADPTAQEPAVPAAVVVAAAAVVAVVVPDLMSLLTLPTDVRLRLMLLILIPCLTQVN
jgi:hypothetical protein